MVLCQFFLHLMQVAGDGIFADVQLLAHIIQLYIVYLTKQQHQQVTYPFLAAGRNKLCGSVFSAAQSLEPGAVIHLQKIAMAGAGQNVRTVFLQLFAQILYHALRRLGAYSQRFCQRAGSTIFCFRKGQQQCPLLRS